MSKGLIICLGSINKDIQVRTDRWPASGEDIQARDLLTLSGGKAANRAYCVCKLGGPALLLARTGADAEAEEVLRPLRDIGVQLAHVKQLAGQRTGHALIGVGPGGEKTTLAAANANQAWEPEGPEQIARVIAQAPKGSVLTLDLQIPAPVAWRALEAARQANFRIILDPSPASQLKAAYYPFADFLTPNLSEAQAMTGLRINSPADAFRAGEAMLARGAGHALVKLGAEGYVLVSPDQRTYIPAPRVRVVDTTGAGDAFAGALAFALWEGQDQIRAFGFAIAASSLAVETYGAQPAYPDRERLAQKLAELKD